MNNYNFTSFYQKMLGNNFFFQRSYSAFGKLNHTLIFSLEPNYKIFIEDFYPNRPYITKQSEIICTPNTLRRYKTTELNKHLKHLIFLKDFEEILFNYHSHRSNYFF